MKVDIICPLYNAEKYIESLDFSIKKQKNVSINKIYYILTESTDNTELILLKNNIDYQKITKKDFSHSLTREKFAYESNAEIIVFITQDIEIKKNDWLEKLIKPIENNEVVATYSRQIAKSNDIEKYIRENNYPQKSIVKSQEDINKLGLNTFFFSDASSAINRKIFMDLNGYDHKNLPISEDMYIAYKIIMAGYKIKYCADSVVYHSHNFSIKELFIRYKLTGSFFKENSFLYEYNMNKSGYNLAKYVLKRILKEKNIKALFRYPFDMGARFIGMKVGKK